MATINNDIKKVGPQRWAELQKANQLQQTGRIVSDEDYITDKETLELLRNNRQMGLTEFVLGQPVNEKIQSDVYRKSGGEDRYGDSMWDPEEIGEADIDNIGNARGENQWTSAKWAAGLVKGANIAGTTLIDGTIGLAYGGVKGLMTGNVNALWDNEVSNAMAHWEEQMEKYAPNYRTDEELANAWYQNLGTANFWADNVLKNMGFTVGAFYSGSVANKVIGKGLRFLRGNTAQKLIGTTVNSVNEGRKEANSFLKEARDEEYAKLEESYARAIQDVNDKYANMGSDLVPVKDVEGIIVGWDPKYKAYDNEMANLKEQFERRKKEIDDNIASQGLQVMVGSTVVTSIADWFTISKLYGTSNKMTKNFISRGYTPEEAAKLTARTLGNAEASNLVLRDGRWAVEEITKGKAIAKGLGVAALEGPYEEMMQAVNSEYAKLKVRQDDPDAYYKALTDKNYQLQADKSIEQLGEAFSNVYLNPERWEEGFTGAIIGGLGMPKFGKSNDNSYTWAGKGKALGMQGGFMGEIRHAESMNAEAEKRAKAMNDYLEKRDKQTRHFAQSMAFMEATDGYDPQTQKFEQKNAKDNADFAGLAAYADAGRLEDYKQLISEDFANMSDEDLNTAGTVIRNKEEIAARTKLGEYDNEGILTEKGREILRKELEEKKQKMFRAADIFERAYTRAYNQFSPYGFSQDDIMELTWLDWKNERFGDRGIDLRNTMKDKLTSLKGHIDTMVEDLQKKNPDTFIFRNSEENRLNKIKQQRQGLEKKIDSLSKDIENAREALFNLSDAEDEYVEKQYQKKKEELEIKETQLAQLESQYNKLKEKEGKFSTETKDKFVERCKHYSEALNDIINAEDPLAVMESFKAINNDFVKLFKTGKLPKAVAELLLKDGIIIQDESNLRWSKELEAGLEDMGLIAAAQRQYIEKWMDYVTHPEKLQQNHDEVDKQNKAANDFFDSVNINENVRKIPMDILRNLPEDKLNELEGKVTDPDVKEDLAEVRKTLRTIAGFKEEVKKLNPGMADEFSDATTRLLRSEIPNASITDPSSEAWGREVLTISNEEDPKLIAERARILRQAFANVAAKEASVLPAVQPQDTVGQDESVQVPSVNEVNAAKETDRRKESENADYIQRISNSVAEKTINQLLEQKGSVSDEEKDSIYKAVNKFWESVCPSIRNSYKELSTGQIMGAIGKSEAFTEITSFGKQNNISFELNLEVKDYIDFLKKTEAAELKASNASTAVTITNPTLEDLEPKPEQQTQQLPKEELQNYWRLATRRLPMSPIHGDMTPFPTIVKDLLAHAENSKYYDNFNKLFPGRDFKGTMNYYSEEITDGVRRIDRVKAIYDYLNRQGAFGYVDNLNIKAGTEVFFKVDPELNKTTNDFVILLAVKDNNGLEHIIGDLSVEDEAGSQNNLKEFIGRVKASYEKNKEEGKIYTYEYTTHIAQMLNGVVPYAYNEDGSHKLISLKEAFGDKRVVLTYAKKDDKSHKAGLPLLYLSSPRGSIRIPFVSPVFNMKTLEKDRDGALVTSVYQAVDALKVVFDLHNDGKKIAQLKGNLENILAFRPNSNGNASLWIKDLHEKGELQIEVKGVNDKQKESFAVNYNDPEFTDKIVKFLASKELLFKIRNDVFNSRKEKDKAIAENFIELSQVNLQPGVTHTISNWFILNPLDANNVELKATPFEETYTGQVAEPIKESETLMNNGREITVSYDGSDKTITIIFSDTGNSEVLSPSDEGNKLDRYRGWVTWLYQKHHDVADLNNFYVPELKLWYHKNSLTGAREYYANNPQKGIRPAELIDSVEIKEQGASQIEVTQEKPSENKPVETSPAEEVKTSVEASNVQQEAEVVVQEVEITDNVQNVPSSNTEEVIPASTEEPSDKQHDSLIEGLSDELRDFYEKLVQGTEWENKIFEDVSTPEELENRLTKVKGNTKKRQLPDINKKLFRKVSKSSNYVPTDIKKEVAWLKKVLPQLSSSERLVIVDTLIRGKNAGELAWGMFNKGVMFIYNEASKGTTFHEAFHAVTHLILSSEERERMLQEGAAKYNLTDKVDIEEAIAEDFRRYVQLEEKPVVGFFVRLFRMLKNVLNVFSKHPAYINKLFYDIQSGNFADKKLNDYTSIDPTMYSSATDNIGTFSTENDDIRFRLVPDAQKWVAKYAEIVDGIKKANDERDLHPEFFTRGYHTATEAWSIIHERKFLGGAKPEYNRGRWYIKPTTGDERASYKEYLKHQVENAILGRETFGSYAEYAASQNGPSKQFPKKKHVTSKQAKMLKQWQQDVERTETEIEEERMHRNLQARRLRKLMWGNLSEELKESLTNDGIDYVLWNKMSMDVRETYIKCHGL